ncbi:hypothetical protein [Sorangium sp. So ce1099]
MSAPGRFPRDQSVSGRTDAEMMPSISAGEPSAFLGSWISMVV